MQHHYRMRSEVEGIEEPAVGHSADLLTLGFEFDARLQRLARAALEQMPVAVTAMAARRTGLYAALPGRGRQAVRAVSPDDDDEEPPLDDAAWARRLLSRSLAGLAWPAAPQQRFVSTDGHAAGVRALVAAAHDLAAGTVDAALVLAADSLLDEASLRWLHSRGRLKCDGAPSGVRPGEAAAALLLIRPADAAQTPVAHTRLLGLALHDEAKPQSEGAVSSGVAMARTVAAVRQSLVQGKAWLLSDHNGEHYRANELGCAWARLRADDPSFADAEVWYPALAFGDTGAACALVGVSMATQAWQRGYAPSAAAVVACASDGPTRGALLLHHG